MEILGTSTEMLIRRTGNRAQPQLEAIAKSILPPEFRLGQLLRMALFFLAQNRAIHMMNCLVNFKCISNIRALIQVLKN